MPNEVLLSDAKSELLMRMRRGQPKLPPKEEEAIQPRVEGALVPLSPSQRQIWLHSQMAPGVPIYNEPITIRRRGPLDREILEQSFQELVRRHEIWGTTFATLNDQVVQAVRPHPAIQIPYSDLSSLPEEKRETVAIRLATNDAQLPFSLNGGPLLRLRLVKLGRDDYRFHLTFHHLVFDGTTVFRVLLPELAAIYAAFAEGRPSPLPEPRLQYADYALWRARQLETDFVARQLAYWRQRLEGKETATSQLPPDRSRPAVPTFRGSMEIVAFPPELIEEVKRTAHEEGVTTYMLLLACFKTLLYRYNGDEDLMVGAVTDGRRRAEFESLVGDFTNTVVLRTNPSGETTFRQFLGQVKDVVLDAMANRDLPFDSLVREVHRKRNASFNPFYQVLFSIDPPPQNDQHPGWEVEQLGIDTGATKCDLFIALNELENGMIGRFQYSSDLFDRETVRRMIGHWLTLVEGAVRDPGAKLRDLPVLTPAETRELADEWNQTDREFPAAAVHQLIDRQACLTPDAVAVEAAGVRLTYRELQRRTDRLAMRLRNAGVTAGTLVAVYAARNVDLIVAPLAVLKAGGAYLPLDPGYPKDRLAYVIEDAHAAVLLLSRGLEDQLPGTGVQKLYSDEHGDGADALPAVTPDSLAYVRYTSGSTGRPKGVEICHRALTNLLLSMQREPGFTKVDSVLAITAHSFDISDLELYLPLISGGRLVIATRDEALDPRLLVERLRKAKCTVLQATPTTWRGLIDAGWRGQPNLKALCGGEALPRELAELLLPRTAQLWNMYGPTETTVWSAVHRVRSGTGPVPIGHPIDNTQMYVLDANQNLVLAGATGEICIGGAGVARGYLRDREPVRRFIPNPFRPGEKLYRTGDLGRWMPGQTLECLGRVDDRVKIRGFRIEPGEIEAVLSRQEAVGQCVVAIRDDAQGGRRLVAYFTSPADRSASVGDLRAELKKFLPEYMIPAAFVRMDRMPLTPNGKIDRKALPAPEEGGADHAGFAGPRDALEHTLERIFARALKVKQVGIHDDFFETGGHSLAAVQMLVQIQKVTGKTLPLATLLQASTVDALAGVLRREGWTPSWSSLVPLQPLGSKPPLFLVHGAEGNVLLYRQLVQHLGADQPVYGLQSQGLSGNGQFHATIHDMASHYVKEVIAAQPDGPYFLGGYCLGGTIAYEMARQLTALGKRVELVVLLDTYNISTIYSSHVRRQAPLRLLQNLCYHCANAVSLTAPERSKFVREKREIAVARIGIRLHAVYHAARRLGGRDTQHRYPHLLVKKTNDQAAEEYIPVQYAGRVAVIQSKGSFAGLGRPNMSWEPCVGDGLETHDLPMYPKGMLIEPFCRLLAQVLNQVLFPRQDGN